MTVLHTHLQEFFLIAQRPQLLHLSVFTFLKGYPKFHIVPERMQWRNLLRLMLIVLLESNDLPGHIQPRKHVGGLGWILRAKGSHGRLPVPGWNDWVCVSVHPGWSVEIRLESWEGSKAQEGFYLHCNRTMGTEEGNFEGSMGGLSESFYVMAQW